MDISRLRAALLVLAVAALSACGGSQTPTSPAGMLAPTPEPTPVPTADVAGDWAGSVRDSVAGVGQLSVTARQNGANVHATWSIIFNNTSRVHTEGGALTGKVNGDALDATATPDSSHTCGFHLTATIDGNHITGDYTARSCNTIGNGRVDIRRGSPL